MYEQSTAHHTASYGYPQYPAAESQKHFPAAHSASSAFSASANSNEDWTQITDLAERRRIQNRIAQRNYRKKLKKRMEDLERRARSTSSSPEQSHDELPPTTQASRQPSSQRPRSSNHPRAPDHTSELLVQPYILPSVDRGMFSQQYTRQISTSPPPFACASLPSSHPPAPCCAMSSSGMDMPLYPQFLAPMYEPYDVQGTPHIKQEFCDDDEISPFSMSYATMAGVDISAANPSYYDAAAYTPSLADSFDHSQAGSPPEFVSMPRTPPTALYHQY